MSKNKYTQRQWARGVGWGEVPEEYKIKEVNVSFNMKESENVQSCEDKPTRSNDRDNKS